MINGETKEGGKEGGKGEKKEKGRRKRDGHSPCRIINKLKGDSNIRPPPRPPQTRERGNRRRGKCVTSDQKREIKRASRTDGRTTGS